MRTILQDFRFALRMVARRPGLSALTVLTLGVGLGGTLMILAFGQGLLGNPPFRDPNRLVRVFNVGESGALEVASFSNLADIASVPVFTDLTIHQRTSVSYGLADATESATVELVSGSFFQTLGVPAAAGRVLEPADDRIGGARLVAVVSDRWARTRLGGPEHAIGATIHLNGTAFSVVGVAPPGFSGAYAALRADVWTPLMAYDVVRPRGLDIMRRGWGWLIATARLAGGVSMMQAQAELDARVSELRRTHAPTNETLRLHLVPMSTLPEATTPVVRRALLVALLLAALTLVAACANAANAQMAAVFDRQREISIRLALGASRVRIARQWLTESLVLTVAATAIGALAAAWARDALGAVPVPGAGEDFNPPLDVTPALAVVTTALAFIVTGLFGVLPARQAAEIRIADRLREESGSTVGSPRRSRSQTVLVVAQVAVSMALVSSAALLAQSLVAARAFDLGFPTRGLTVARANVSGLDYDDERLRTYYRDTLGRIRALPGVQEAALAATVPLGDSDERQGIAIEGYTPRTSSPFVSTDVNVVSPGYFRTMEIPVVAGRAFEDSDTSSTAPLAAIVNATLAQRYWPGTNGLGRSLRFGDGETARVVGIVADITYVTPGEAPVPFVYLPAGRIIHSDMTVHVRTPIPDPTMARALAREIRALDSRIRVSDAMSYQDLRAAQLIPQRVLASVGGAFGGLAVLLAAVGIYGVLSCAVGARTREFAVRMALGAAPARLIRQLVGQAVAWCALGLAIGAGLSIALGGLVSGMLFGVAPFDLRTFGAAAAVVLTVGMAAAYLPARRIGRTSAMTVLRR